VIADYLDLCRGLVDSVAAQEDAIAEAAALFSETILAGRMVHLFGSGHSRILVEEMWPRYGSFPGFNPIVELSLSFHNLVVGANGQRQAMFLENVHGLAGRILRNYDITAQDTALIASSSGCNLVPIEMAEEFKRRGVKVVAIISKAHSEASRSQRRDGRKLQDFADIVLDTGAPVGDAMIEVPGLETPVGPGSTIGGCLLINSIKVEVAALLTEAGQPPTVLTAPALVGREASAEIFEKAYDEHAHRLSALYATAGENVPAPAGGGRDRNDRGDRGERRGRRGDEREARPERSDRGPRDDRGPREERVADRPERAERTERPERAPERAPERSPRPERADRPERAERPERREERPARPEGRGRGEDRPARPTPAPVPVPAPQAEEPAGFEEGSSDWDSEETGTQAEVVRSEPEKPSNWSTMDDIERRLWLRQNSGSSPEPRAEGARAAGGRSEGGRSEGGRGERGGRDDRDGGFRRRSRRGGRGRRN
jgi:uncharacterized phosphosugar-binding protein